MTAIPISVNIQFPCFTTRKIMSSESISHCWKRARRRLRDSHARAKEMLTNDARKKNARYVDRRCNWTFQWSWHCWFRYVSLYLSHRFFLLFFFLYERRTIHTRSKRKDKLDFDRAVVTWSCRFLCREIMVTCRVIVGFFSSNFMFFTSPSMLVSPFNV